MFNPRSAATLRVRNATVALAALPLLGACGTMFRETHQAIGLEVQPAGTEVSFHRFSGEVIAGPARSPDRIDVRRPTMSLQPYLAVMSHDRYCPQYAVTTAHQSIGVLILDAFAAGLVGELVDAAAGGANSFEPDPIRASLPEETTCAE